MPMIRVTDKVYDQLKKRAEENYRTIGGQIDYLLALDVDDEVRRFEERMVEEDEARLADRVPRRSKGDILADIREQEAKRDEELRFNQDADVALGINQRYGAGIDKLWKEYGEAE